MLAILTNPVVIDALGGIVRHLLTAVGGILVAKGFLSAGVMDQAVGIGMAVIGSLWSLLAKVQPE